MYPVLLAVGLLSAVGLAFAALAYIAYRGSKPSGFFLEAVQLVYDLQLPEVEIAAYYELKDRLYSKHAESSSDGTGVVDASGAPVSPADAEVSWLRNLAPEELVILKKALMMRLVRDIDRLDQVQRDKPGNWKLWRGKLVSERYWGSLLEAERLVSEEIDNCVAEAEVLEPGWREHVFPQAVQCWRMEKMRDMEKKAQKKAVETQKKAGQKEIRAVEVAAKQVEEDIKRKERAAEKAMEKLLQEEEKDSKAKKKPGKSSSKEERAPAPKSATKKKK